MRRGLLVIALAVGLGACSSDDGGEADSAPDEGVTTATTTTVAPDETAPATAEPSLTSSAFEEGGAIPVEHGGCPPGENLSPPLAWEGLPPDVEQLAITAVDPDAGGFVHWVIAGIDPSTEALAAGEVPAGAVEAMNDTGQAGYFGPCPPETHTYEFTVHALSEDPGITATTSGTEAVTAIQGATEVGASLSGEYEPQPA